MSASETAVCRACRRGIFRHGDGAWLHEYRPINEQHPAEPRIDPQGPECAGRVAERKRGEMWDRMLDAARFPGKNGPGNWPPKRRSHS